MILGIRNRTENWKTAQSFAPLLRNGAIHLANRLGELKDTAEEQVDIELFWYGMRDHFKQENEQYRDDDLADRFECLFPDLRERIEDFGKFRPLTPDNYRSSTRKRRVQLATNLYNTEIDIVAESPTSLFIGEAKHEMSLGADSDLVLVHQLIRQFVMAKVLLDIQGSCKNVVPFVVGEIKDRAQIQFMIAQGWMKDEGVLKWTEVEALAS